VPTDENRNIKTFAFDSGFDVSNIKVNRDVEPYQFMLDNVILNK